MEKMVLRKENAEKVIKRLESYGRKIDHHCAMILFRNLFENKTYEVEYYDDLCDIYGSALWNYNFVR